MSHDGFDPVTEMLQALPRSQAPERLSDQLRVLGSRESLRRRRRSSPRAFFGWWADCISLFFNNLMKPVAVPFAGGVVSAVILLLSVLAPVYPVQREIARDVPSPIFTRPMVLSSLALPDSDVDLVVDVWIDEQGRMLDYAIPGDPIWAADPSVVRSVEATLLCTRFSPATLFGQPASGKIRITFRRSHVEVRG